VFVKDLLKVDHALTVKVLVLILHYDMVPKIHRVHEETHLILDSIVKV